MFYQGLSATECCDVLSSFSSGNHSGCGCIFIDTTDEKFEVYEMSTIPISTEGFAKVKKELDALKRERPAVIKAISEAREEGDLKENGGYHAARERQGMMEAKINYIESRIPHFNIIDLSTLGGSKIIFGATVELEDIETGDKKIYTIMGPDESDFKKGIISIESPVGKALLGKEEGDEVLVNAPRGKIEYAVVSVTFKGAVS